MGPISSDLSQQAQVITQLDLDALPPGQISRYWLHLVTDGMGMPVYVPILVARGREDGPTLGLTAAVHGNEINGIPVIQRLFRELDPNQLRGTLVGVLVTNVPSLLLKQRRFIDGTDLNHIMPGREDGNVSEVYAYRIIQRVVRHFDYLLDLHTASFGRINSYYIRADMAHAKTRKMALLQNAQIIVHNPPLDGTLRGAADALGIPAVTLEVGNPHVFQKGLIRSGLTGIYNLLYHLDMVEGEIEEPDEPARLCSTSEWMFTDTGGILAVHPVITQQVAAGEVVATVRDVFGSLKKEYRAPHAGIVIGKSVDPINQTGGRILHLGTLDGEGEKG